MKLRSLACAAIVSCLALTGCGTTDAPKTAAAASGGDPVSITDSRGAEVKLDAPAKKVVTLEWSVTEYVAALGVEPVGVADPKGYRDWAKGVPLTGEPTDVGVRTEPSVDAIAGLAPDLILADTGSIPEDAMKQMERIAPVAVLASATTDGLIERAKKNQRDVAALLGAEDAAKKLEKDFDQKIAAAKTKVSDAGRAGTRMVFTYPNAQANAVSFRMHGPGSAPSAVGEAIGMADAWTKPGDAEYGLTETDVEGLRALPDDTVFLYWSSGGQPDPLGTLNKNRVWAGLPFVKAGHVSKAGSDVWIYGGTVSLAGFAGEVADIVVKR